jgi:hypothetical protein
VAGWRLWPTSTTVPTSRASRILWQSHVARCAASLRYGRNKQHCLPYWWPGSRVWCSPSPLTRTMLPDRPAAANPTAASRRLLLAALLSVASTKATGYCSEELVPDNYGSFGSIPASLVSASASRGAYSTVSTSNGTMASFPGKTGTALQLVPSSASPTKATLLTGAAHRAVGWYHVRGYIYLSLDYSGTARPVALSTTGPDGTEILVETLSTALKTDRRGEWIHVDDWVPSNQAEATALQLAVDPGDGFTTGYIQLTDISVCFEPRARARPSRGLQPAALVPAVPVAAPRGDRVQGRRLPHRKGRNRRTGG